MLLRSWFFLILLILFNASKINAKDIPIIVISAGKSIQSISTVGSDIEVIGTETIEKSEHNFLVDIINENITGANYFQSGGHGTSSAIQLRGLPKRYSTVFIDGVKMSDPSSVSNDFDFANILTSHISRVEILKGNQSSVYGSGAIGGTIHITTKKGKPGFKKDVNYATGSHGTHNLSTSVSGGDETSTYYVGLQRFQTDGISQMIHNDESDAYRNNSLTASFSDKLSDTFDLQRNIRIAETRLQYDAVCITNAFGCSSTRDHGEEVNAVESSANISLTHKSTEKLTNKFTVANTYIERIYIAAPNSKNTKEDGYYGGRYALLYQGNYNFDLDNSIVFGLEREDDQMGFAKDEGERIDSNAYITSQYFDYQSRITKNLYGTFGARFDEHSLAGTGSNEDSHRATLAYVFDNKNTKLKSSYGTGYRFPSLYEMLYVYNSSASVLPYVSAEKSKSYDFGIEKSFMNSDLILDLTYFNAQYNDPLEGWATNSSTTKNVKGNIKTQGIELTSGFKLNEIYNFGLNYTYTQSYDGADEDNPSTSRNAGSQMVRVPRNLVNLITNIKVPRYKDLDITLRTKWSDKARDYGNGNPTSDKSPAYQDEELDSYLVNDLSFRYNYFDNYNIYFDIANVLDKEYETVVQYSQLGRGFNFGIKKTY